jgi:response regulator RpfG family c-di-GMP phosphodiesterase
VTGSTRTTPNEGDAEYRFWESPDCSRGPTFKQVGMRLPTARPAADIDRPSMTETATAACVEILIGLLEARNYETARHAMRVGETAGLVAEALGIPKDDADSIARASSLHDIGKLGLPDRVLLKAGPLTIDEREKMKLHTTIGHQMLSRLDVPVLETAATVAWTHHERYDGSGYPRGIQGDQIPLEGQLAAVADTFDALTSVRPYRPAYPIPAAVRYLVSERGKLFAPDVVDAFHDSIDAIVELRAGLARSAPPST